MSLNDLKSKLMKKFFRAEGDASRRPDGGTSCYRPIRKKNPAENRGQEEQQPLTYIHTGFTGMNPPATQYDTGFGRENSGRGGYGQDYGPQNYGQPNGMQTNYGPQGFYTQPDYGFQAGSGMQPNGRQAGNETAFGGGRIRTEEAPVTAARPERGWFPMHENAVPRNNISYMPGYSPDAGAAPFSHVEHIMILTGLKSCYEAIECMRNGETLIIELDAIANENESMRCQDMLAGAAFTLGCSVRVLQGGRLVLIAPDGVKILPEESTVRPEMIPPVYAAPVQESAPRQRERRSGRNADDWNAARSGQMDSYNPYTGTMPAAAGSYGNYGGYGY